MNRLLLAIIGVGMFAVGLLQDRTELALALTIVGAVVVVLAVIYPRVTSFSLGPEGLKADLERIEREIKAVEHKVDAIIVGKTLEVKVEIPTPSVEATQEQSVEEE